MTAVSRGGAEEVHQGRAAWHEIWHELQRIAALTGD
jgi:hypothetical protein